MNKRKVFSVIAILIVGAILGGAIGSYSALHFTSLFWINATDGRTTLAIQHDVEVLKLLREGSTERAIELLEIDLDGNLITFSADMPNTEQWKDAAGKSLKSAKEYRAESPRTTSYPEIDEAVATALSKAEL